MSRNLQSPLEKIVPKLFKNLINIVWVKNRTYNNYERFEKKMLKFSYLYLSSTKILDDTKRICVKNVLCMRSK